MLPLHKMGLHYIIFECLQFSACFCKVFTDIFILHVKLYLTISLNFMMSYGSSCVDAAENLKFLCMQDPFHLNYLSLIAVESV